MSGKSQSNQKQISYVKKSWFLPKSPNSEAGLTLLESLVAILVVSAVITAVTAPIFASVATRVQNRRADQAKQLAQGAVDRVRRLVEGNYTLQDLNRFVPVNVGNANLSEASVPPTNEQLVYLNGNNGDNKNVFRVQVFRGKEVIDLPGSPNAKPVNFCLGVRVYVHFNNNGQALEPQPVRLTWTSALGSQQRRPLAVMYTRVAAGDATNALENYRSATTSGTSSCP